MRIALIGTVMHDDILLPDGQRRVGYGGILYGTMALLPLTSERDTILPVGYLGADDREEVLARHLAAHRRIETHGLRTSPEGSDTAALRYLDADGARDERQTRRTPPLAAADLEPAWDAQAVVLNPVTGHEFSLAVARNLRTRTRAHVHLDVHSLARQPDAEGRLMPRRLENWREWLASVDSVQANAAEVASIIGTVPRTDDEIRRATLVLASPTHLRAAIVTLGVHGCALASRLPGEDRLYYLRLPALPGCNGDTTGCGDVFAAAFAVVLERRRRPLEAALVATALAGLHARGAGLDALGSYVNVADVSRAAFPALWVAVDAGWPGETIDDDEVFRAVRGVSPA